MSVIPEPISRKDERQSDSISSNNVRTSEESFSLPSILRGAAYISSGGRVYRLFSDNDEITFPMASFEQTLQLDPLPEVPPIEDFVSPLEDFILPLEESSEPLTRLATVSSEETVKNIPVPPSILQSKQQHSELSISEKNPQEYSVPPKIPSKEKTTFQVESYKIFSETEKKEQSDTTQRTPLYQLTQEISTLKLFEVLPELSISSSVSLMEIPKKVDSLGSKSSASKKPKLIIISIVRMIHLKVHRRSRKRKCCFYQLSLRYLEKVRYFQPTQHENTPKSMVNISVLPTDENIERFIPTLDAELAIPLETTLFLSETKPSLPESSSTESSDNKSDTLPFPLHELLPSETNRSDVHNNNENNNNGTWRLIWQSHWPEYLKSLELAASDQICFLADHLEIQKEQKRRVFSFNSFQPGDGCTTLALCASRELAERGYRVLLVDAHRRNPELPQLLHLKTNPDFCEIITLIPDRLELLPWSETSIEVNTDDRVTQSFAEIVGSFRNDYDFILLDNGSLVECSLVEHVSLWHEMCSDGVLLVLNMKNPAPVSVRTIAQRLQQNQINLLGIVENCV